MTTNFDSVRDKLAEAQFFIFHLRQEQEKTAQQRQQEAFRYYLSAFLSGCYSVRQYFEKEATRLLRSIPHCKQLSGKQAKTKYIGWIDEWVRQRSKEELAIWELMQDHRDNEVHESRVKTTPVTKAVPADPFPRSTSPYGGYPPYFRASPFYAAIAAAGNEFNLPLAEEKQKLGLPGWCTAWTYSEAHHINVNGQQITVVEVCEKYHQLLGTLVQDLEAFLRGQTQND